MPRDQRPLNDRERLEHMLAAGRDAVFIASGRTRAELDGDVMLRHALVRCVQIIGEAAARVGEGARARVPDLPWPRVVGMRHILVHAYYKVDLDAVWRVVSDHIPQMVPLLEQALKDWEVPETDAEAGPAEEA